MSNPIDNNTPIDTGAESAADNPRCSRKGKRRGRKLFFLAVLTGLLAVGAMAFAKGGGPGGFGFGGCERGEMDPAEARDRAGHFAERILNRVDATDEQREQIDALLDETVPKMLAHKSETRALRKAAKDALTAENLDAEVLEGLRQELLTEIDKGTADALDAMLKVGAILTPEQRAQLAKDAQRMHRRGHRGTPDAADGLDGR